jgi:RHS repeat-associated protein
VGQIGFTKNGTWRMMTTKAYDYLNRLTEISSVPSGDAPVSFAYDYNLANQRTVRREADGSYWRYEYDRLGQVRSGKKYWSDGTPAAGQRFEYSFDDIGNRTGTKAGGDENGVGLRSAAYSANALNQYTSREVPGAVDVMGIAFATNTVTVNGQGVYRKGEYFRAELPIDNSSAPVWTNITVSATGQASVSGNALLSKTPETFAFDGDGNLVQDGLWSYTWDTENRLVSMQSVSSVPSAAKLKLDFAYDHLSRRTQKVISTWNGSAYVPQYTNRFVYDGWNLAVTLASDLCPLASFTWGLDLSGSLQGAGGVGGLLWMTIPSGTNAGTYFYAHDGNGNVTALLNAADGSVAARYEYGPFGELIRATRPMAIANPFRLSTKYQDDQTDLLYYGYRYYSAIIGRWISRDPIEEKGGPHLFSFVGNDPSGRVDPLGQDYYIASIDGITCIRHRVMIGDDGFGGYYWIELYPDTITVGMLKECQRRICGKGIINYLHAKGSAKDKFDELKNDKDAGAKLVKHVKTTRDLDQALAAGAAAYGAKKTTTYCFILNDCWSIERNVRETCAQQALCKKLNEFLTKELFKLAYPNP